MIAADGKMHVFTVTEYYESDSCTISIHDTSEGAANKLKELGYRYMTAGPDGWLGHGWYKHYVEGHFRDEWWKGVIDEVEVQA